MMNYLCGKKPHVFDEKTVIFSRFMDSQFRAPSKFDFDKGRAEIPIQAGGIRVACDVTASMANQLLRFGRIDQRRTIEMRPENVTMRYRAIQARTGGKEEPGITVLDAMKSWSKDGWNVKGKNYKISLYGEIEPNEHEFLRTAIYVFRGVHIGLMIPDAVKKLERVWDFDGQSGEEWKPGPLGVLAYCKAYNRTSYEIILWGERIQVSNRFVDHYSDEAWISIEALDYWGSQVLDLHTLARMYPHITDIKQEKEVRG
jgi:hypothetical protein